jgi:hypothetical protein
MGARAARDRLAPADDGGGVGMQQPAVVRARAARGPQCDDGLGIVARAQCDVAELALGLADLAAGAYDLVHDGQCLLIVALRAEHQREPVAIAAGFGHERDRALEGFGGRVERAGGVLRRGRARNAFAALGRALGRAAQMGDRAGGLAGRERGAAGLAMACWAATCAPGPASQAAIWRS